MSKKKRLLVACECSGVVRSAFRKIGWDAWSCDILPADDGDKHHIQDDVLKHLNEDWDMLIGHPECTFLAVSGAKWFYHPADKHLPVAKRRPHPQYPNRRKDQAKAIDFFMKLYNAPIERIAIENPIGVMSTKFRKPNFIMQPWHHGTMETKATCIWTRNLPDITWTNNVYDQMMKLPKSEREKIHYMAPSKDRSKDRSVTYQCFADVWAAQWGHLP